MKKFLSFIALAILASCNPAFATGPTSSGVQQVGSVTATHCANWTGKDSLADSGAPCSAAQIYPSSGVAVSTGSAWGTSLQVGTSGAVLGLLNGNNTFGGNDVFSNPITGNIAGNAATVTTNANLSGVVTSSGNATSFGSFSSATFATALTNESGSGLVVFNNAPTLVAPVLGSATGTAVTWSGVDTALNFSATGTGADTLPIGTTGQRPANAEGLLRDNTTFHTLETYLNGGWQQIVSATNGLVNLATQVTGTLGTTNGGTGQSSQSSLTNVLNVLLGSCYGDSLTAGNQDGTGISYCSVLSQLTGANLTNSGIPGQTSSQIIARMGAGNTTLTLSGNQIVSGSNSITAINGSTVQGCATGCSMSPNVELLSTVSDNISRSILGTICGLHGTLSRSSTGGPPSTSETYTFTPDGSPTTTSCSAASSFVTDNNSLNGQLTIYSGGRNDSATPSIVEANDALVKTWLGSNKNWLIPSVINGEGEGSGTSAYNNIAAINANRASLYGSNYLDIRAYLVSQYNPNNALDVIDHGNDIPPFSLRAVDLRGTLNGAITTTNTCSTNNIVLTQTQNAVSTNSIILVDNEYIYVTTISGNTITACTRGYGSTTATTHLTGAAYLGTDPLHLSAAAYTLEAKYFYSNITSWLSTFWYVTTQTLQYFMGSGVLSPEFYSVSLSGVGNQIIAVLRSLTGAGSNLSLQAGGAVANTANQNGGNLILSSGISTGTGSSLIQFQTFPAAGSSSIQDNLAQTDMTLTSSGTLGIGTAAPASLLHIYGTFSSGNSLTISQDQNTSSNGQIIVKGKTNANQQLYFGYNTSTDQAFLQAIKQGSAYEPLFLNSGGGGVAIGTTVAVGVLNVGGTIKTSGYTVATLPSGTVGMRAYVTDQTTACPLAGAALTGSGLITCPVFYNGSAWVGD